MKKWGLAVASSVLAASLAQSCLLSAPPTYEDPAPQRPNVNVNQVIPPVYQVLNLQRGVPVIFTVPFRSVDAGEDVWWFLWANWNLEDEAQVDKNELKWVSDETAMGGAGAVERPIQFSWAPGPTLRPGCNQLTLFVTHESNADFAQDRPIDLEKAAVLTWWTNVDAALGEEQTLRDCPGPPSQLVTP